MMLWDWPNILRGMKKIEASRLGGIYSEVAPTLRTFAQLFGKALQAQMRIAVVNTLLTCCGMYLLRIPGLLLLSLFVFMCRRAASMRCSRCCCLAQVLLVPCVSAVPEAVLSVRRSDVCIIACCESYIHTDACRN